MKHAKQGVLPYFVNGTIWSFYNPNWNHYSCGALQKKGMEKTRYPIAALNSAKQGNKMVTRTESRRYILPVLDLWQSWW